MKHPAFYLAVALLPFGFLIAPALMLRDWMRDPNRVHIQPRTRVYQTRNVTLEVVK